jgi:hypothetical protein
MIGFLGRRLIPAFGIANGGVVDKSFPKETFPAGAVSNPSSAVRNG